MGGGGPTRRPRSGNSSPPQPMRVVQRDPELDNRRKDLLQQVETCVLNGGGKVRRVKRSSATWKDVHTSKSVQNRDFVAFALVGGAVIAVASAAAFAAIGWWVLIPGFFLAILIAVIKHYLTKHWTNSKVVAWLKEQDEIIANGGTMRDPDLEKDGYLVECMLEVMTLNHNRLESKLEKYYSGSYSRKAKKFFRKSYENLDENRMKERLKQAFELAFGQQPLKLGQSLSGSGWVTTKFSKKKGWGGLIGSSVEGQDSDEDILKLAILIGREKAYIEFCQNYFELLKEKVEGFYGDIADTDKAISKFIDIQISFNRSHMNCSDKCCFGPQEENLVFSPLTSTDTTGMSTGLQRVETHLQNITVNNVGDLSRALGDEEDHLDNISQGADLAADTVITSVTEAMESFFSEAFQESAGGMAADLTMSPVGWVLAIAIGEVMESFTVNRPTYKQVGKIRNALRDDVADLDDAVKNAVKKGKANMLQRALNKTHSHYMTRMNKRAEKLKAAYEVMKTKTDGVTPFMERWVYTCDDAVRLARYLMKVYHYSEKTLCHIIFLRSAVNVIRKRLGALRAMSNTPTPPPAPPTNPPGGNP